MKHVKAKLLASLLCLPLAFTACTENDNGSSAFGGAGEVEIWSTYATEKILRDQTADVYEDVRLPARVDVGACKGEYESAQVIMTATKDVGAYNAEIVSDLVGSNGETFAKENIELRKQVYSHLRVSMSDYNDPPLGYYPDALVPLDKIVEAGENTIEAGENQGLYVTFWVPLEQAAGVYTGSLNIKYDGKEETVPVKLTVYDLTVSQETRSESYFNLGFNQHLGDLSSSQEMWTIYTKELIRYRLAPGCILANVENTEEKYVEFVELAADLVVNYGMSSLAIPSMWRSGPALANILVRLAKKSIEINYNLLENVNVKGTDEPSLSMMPQIGNEKVSFQQGLDAAEKEVRELTGATPEFINELADSVQAIPYIITMMYSRDDQTEGNVETYCPLYQLWNTEEMRDLYDDQWKGRWWYGCVNPRPPYPTYHTEDTLVSARSVGWMMSEYDIVGNLYWSATVYAQYNGNVYIPIDDYYDSLTNRFHTCNGDGFLFYPAIQYGVEGPFSSLRLEAIRDGNEEYELWYDLNAAYEAAGYSADVVQRNISELIYSGTIVKFDNISSQFEAARKAMIQLCMLAQEGVFITDIANDGKGNLTYEVMAEPDHVVKNNGATLTGTTVGDKVKYEITCSLNDVANAIALTVEIDGKEYQYGMDLGGKMEYYTANALYEAISFADENATIAAALDGEKLRLDVGAVEGKHQNFRYTSEIFSSLGADANRLVFSIENPTEEAISVRILVRLSGAQFNTELYAGVLQPGVNNIEVDLSALKISDSRKIQWGYFYFSAAPDDYAAKTIYLNSIAVYHNKED